MERLIRFLISQFLNGVVTCSGLVIILYAVANFRASYELLALMHPEIDTQQEFLLELASAFEAAFDDPALFLLPPVLWMWLVFPGLLLFGYGIRRMVRRLVNGLPEQEVGPPESASAFWGTTAVYAVFLFMTAPSLISGFIKAPQSIPPVFFGEEVNASALKVWEDAENSKDGQKAYAALFAFKGVDGEYREATMRVPPYLVKSLREKEATKLIYLPSAPDRIYLPRWVPGRLSYCWSFLWRFALLYLAVCGLLRNFLPTNTAPEKIRASPARDGGSAYSAPGNPSGTTRRPTAPNAPRSGGAKGGFGRRGAS